MTGLGVGPDTSFDAGDRNPLSVRRWPRARGVGMHYQGRLQEGHHTDDATRAVYRRLASARRGRNSGHAHPELRRYRELRTDLPGA